MNAARRTFEREIETVQKTAAIDSDPWLRLFREIHDLPLLRDANAGELAKAFLAIFNIVKLAAPSVIDNVRADAKAGGFAKIRERVVAALKDSNDEKCESVVDVPTVVNTPPGKLTRAEWTRLAQRFPAQRAAVQTTGYGPKTIASISRSIGSGTRGGRPTRREDPTFKADAFSLLEHASYELVAT